MSDIERPIDPELAQRLQYADAVPERLFADHEAGELDLTGLRAISIEFGHGTEVHAVGVLVAYNDGKPTRNITYTVEQLREVMPDAEAG